MQLPALARHLAEPNADDSVLLRRYVRVREQAAFAALVRRHGPMVLGVCKRILENADDADDAFQCVFLVLARRAESLQSRSVLADWLYGVAVRVSLKAQTSFARHRKRERIAVALRQSDTHEAASEWSEWLDREVMALPEKYRLPVLLCLIQDRSRADAAAELGIPDGTLASRLDTARKRLAERLRQHGVPLALGGLLIPVSDSLAESAITQVTDGTPSAMSPLATEVIRAMRAPSKTAYFAAAVLVVAAVGGLLYSASESPVEAPKTQRVEVKAPIPIKEAPPAGEWPVFRGDATMSGAGTAKLPDKLEQRWMFKTGDSVEGAPAVVGGIVYIASLDKHLYAVDLATGKEKWKTKLAPMKASPAVNGKLIVVGDSEGTVHGVDLATGKELWKFATDGEITSGANFHKGSILIGSHDSKLYCLTAEGKKSWEFGIEGPVNGSPAIVEGTTFVAGCDSILHAIDIATGKELWNVDLGGQAAATAAVGGDFAYVGLMTNQVIGIDLKAKKKAWTFEPLRRSQPFYASAALSEEFVVTASRDKKVYALDRKTGKEIWSFVAEASVDASPVIVGDRVYIGCQSSTAEFYVLDLKTGKKLQELTLDSSITGSVAVGPDCILVGTEKGAVYCLGKK